MRQRLYGFHPAQMREMFLRWYVLPLARLVFERSRETRSLVVAVGRYRSLDLEDAVGHRVFLSESDEPAWPDVALVEGGPLHDGRQELLLHECRALLFGDGGSYLDDRGTFATAFRSVCLPTDGPLPSTLELATLRPVFTAVHAKQPTSYRKVDLLTPMPSVLDEAFERNPLPSSTLLAREGQPEELDAKAGLDPVLRALSPEELLDARMVRNDLDTLRWSLRGLANAYQEALNENKDWENNLKYARNRVRGDLKRFLEAGTEE